MAYLPDYDGHLPHLLGHSKDEDKLSSILGYSKLIVSDPSISGRPLGRLSSIHLARILATWIETKGLAEMKRLAYISAKAERMSYQYKPARSLGYGFQRVFAALLSDEPNVIHWFSWHVLPTLQASKGRVPDYKQPGKPHFHAFNCHLALLGEFEWLAERSDEALADGVKLKAGKSYRFDFLFFKALAEGDKTEMEKNIHELLKGKVAHTRNNETGFAYQSKVVSSWGLMLAKIAYRHDYDLEIDSPWVPKEWLPVKPLDHYPEDIDFMADFDMFTPFVQNDAWYKNGIEFSPRSASEKQPNIREWVESVDRNYP
jgi:hypothetical protein